VRQRRQRRRSAGRVCARPAVVFPGRLSRGAAQPARGLARRSMLFPQKVPSPTHTLRCAGRAALTRPRRGAGTRRACLRTCAPATPRCLCPSRWTARRRCRRRTAPRPSGVSERPTPCPALLPLTSALLPLTGLPARRAAGRCASGVTRCCLCVRRCMEVGREAAVRAALRSSARAAQSGMQHAFQSCEALSKAMEL